MKKSVLIVVSFCVMIALSGCAKKTIANPESPENSNTGTQVITTNTAPVAGTDIKVAVDQKVLWEGSKIGGSHSGTVLIAPESLIQVDGNGNLLGGKITILMSTLLSEMGTGGVTEHLKKEDFFDVANQPTSVIVAKSVNGSMVTADITIRGITKEISFPVTLTKDGDAYLLSAQLDLPLKDFKVGDTLLGKVALKDTFVIIMDKVAFIK